ncbi:MAG: hypothetical protein AAB446_00155 [Patescibacteria group bacterium]
MKKLILIIIFALFVSIPEAKAVVVFEDSFDEHNDWEMDTQLTYPNAVNCFLGNCPWTNQPPSGWTVGRIGGYMTDGGCSNPGNKLMYIDQYAGYPTETNSCNGSSGKCLTFWAESCGSSAFDNSDGDMGFDLGSPYQELYVRFYMKFKNGWLWGQGGQGGGDYPQMKLGHYQYWDGVSNPWVYFNGDINWPATVPGLQGYDPTDGHRWTLAVRPYCHDNHNSNCRYTGTPGQTWLGEQADASGFIQTDTSGDFYARGNFTASNAGIMDGAWHQVTLRIKTNTWNGSSWNADGVYQFWLDDVLQVSRSNVMWFGTTAGGTAENPPVRGFRLISFGGNTNNYFATSGTNAGGNREQWYSLDDIIVSTTAIPGDYVIGGGTPPPADTTAPSAPTGVAVQ